MTGVLVIGVINTDGLLYQLYPNRWSSADPGFGGGVMRAGETRLIGGPDGSFVFCASAPAGSARIIAAILPPGPGLDAWLGQAVDLRPVSTPGLWLATLGRLAAEARAAAGLPVNLALGTRSFDVVSGQ